MALLLKPSFAVDDLVHVAFHAFAEQQDSAKKVVAASVFCPLIQAAAFKVNDPTLQRPLRFTVATRETQENYLQLPLRRELPFHTADAYPAKLAAALETAFKGVSMAMDRQQDHSNDTGQTTAVHAEDTEVTPHLLSLSIITVMIGGHATVRSCEDWCPALNPSFISIVIHNPLRRCG